MVVIHLLLLMSISKVKTSFIIIIIIIIIIITFQNVNKGGFPQSLVEPYHAVCNHVLNVRGVYSKIRMHIRAVGSCSPLSLFYC